MVNKQPQPSWQQARSVVLRWLITSLAIFVAVSLVPGIHFTGPGWQLGVVAIIFGLVNVLVRPLLLLLTCPLVLLTFGLFTFVLNALLLGLTSALANQLAIDFRIDDFWAALLGGLIISLVTIMLSALAGEQRFMVRVGRGPENRQ
ncbi:MAG: phage holin family protein [Chloroflexales bacterium]|nr:phage holin family protein [Chloroflexales bacterium]